MDDLELLKHKHEIRMLELKHKRAVKEYETKQMAIEAVLRFIAQRAHYETMAILLTGIARDVDPK